MHSQFFQEWSHIRKHEQRATSLHSHSQAMRVIWLAIKDGFNLLEDGTCENPIDSPVHPMGLWHRTGHQEYLRMGHVRIPGTVTSIPWDCGTGGNWGIYLRMGHVRILQTACPSHGIVRQDGTLGFEGQNKRLYGNSRDSPTQDSAILKNSVQSHGMQRIHGIGGITDGKLGHDWLFLLRMAWVQGQYIVYNIDLLSFITHLL